MDCETAKELMLEFVEGTLDAELSNKVGEHVHSCPLCMRHLEGQSSRTRALQALGRVEAPDQWDEISEAIAESRGAYYLRRYGIPAAIIAFVLALLILIAAIVVRRGKDTPAPVPLTQGHNDAAVVSVCLVRPVQAGFHPFTG